ncbi:hypothetical protein ACFV0R_03670 [Streptomyces sp. NPDC059578]|uniref:hypothetical protein n=1 Tax=Streptomyces sp. NPDC059578 TaxID=3346874 RepID=UPI0036BD4D3D
MTRLFDLDWTLTRLEDQGVWVHIACVSGNPLCGASPSMRPVHATPDGALAWAEEHMRLTGHRRYDRLSFDVVQWDPPGDVDPGVLPGVTT